MKLKPKQCLNFIIVGRFQKIVRNTSKVNFQNLPQSLGEVARDTSHLVLVRSTQSLRKLVLIIKLMLTMTIKMRCRKFDNQLAGTMREMLRKRKGRASRSSSMNDEALARLMVTEMTSQEKEQREAFLEIKRREVECCEREARNHEYRQRQDDIRFYLQPYGHLTRDAQLAKEELRAEIKAKYALLY
uniref:Uncharacterized protein n=1 Tax=Tanacetum cinerariifolium TaxID=118510 RepID=A0A6L2K2W1_TANCI|nr:hypothetical protein [Tanacetum cinerariifolium]